MGVFRPACLDSVYRFQTSFRAQDKMPPQYVWVVLLSGPPTFDGSGADGFHKRSEHLLFSARGWSWRYGLQ